ncbi:MAG: protein kinase [bacterium]|nr:protein kinase [bacterium]
MNLLPDDPEHRDRLLRQLDALLLLDGPARDAALAELEPIAPALAAELRALLAADGQPGSILDEPLFAWAQPLLTEADAALPGGGGAGAAVDEPGEGALLGAWRLGQRLGAGGMGVVYAAQRSDGGFAQHAAIKVLAIGGAGGALAARFEQERAILARLSHPGIARLLDGGVTPAGTPWFAMELVDGMPLTAWCHEQGADLRTRLALIREVAAAVAHAHRHLVVHRDLKPSNILVEPDGAREAAGLRHRQAARRRPRIARPDAGRTAPVHAALRGARAGHRGGDYDRDRCLRAGSHPLRAALRSLAAR